MTIKFITLLALTLGCLAPYTSKGQSPKEKLQIIDDAVKQDSRGNYAIEGMGTIKLKNGSFVDGRLVFNISSSLGSQCRVQHFPENRMSPDDYFPSGVEYFQIGDLVFTPLDVKYDGTGYIIFAQVLNSNPDDKMKLYRMYITDVSSQGASSPYILKKGFFIKMKQENRATQLGGMSLTPFHKSMAKNTEDCPDLSKKVKEKAEGYKVSFLDLDSKNNDVYFRILEEYNACK